VVVQRTAIVYDRRDPDCGKTQVLNVIQLLDEPLEIAPPGYILRIGYGGIDIGIRVVTGPLVGHIVGGVAVKKTGSKQEIDTFLPEIDLGHGRGRQPDGDKHTQQKCLDGYVRNFHVSAFIKVR